MSVIPFSGMVQNALYLASDPNLWVAIGGTNPWPDDANPPAENASAIAVDTIVGYKKVEAQAVCIPDNIAGTIIFAGQNFTIVPNAQAVAQNARFTYLRASINYSELPIVTYRERGVYSGLVPLPAYVGATVLLPSQVQSPGTLVFLAYSTPITRDPSRRDVIEVVREYRS